MRIPSFVYARTYNSKHLIEYPKNHWTHTILMSTHIRPNRPTLIMLNPNVRRTFENYQKRCNFKQKYHLHNLHYTEFEIQKA